MAYLSLTRLRLKHVGYLIPYLIDSAKIVREIIHSDGFIAGKVLAAPNLSMWTATLWSSKQASKAFHTKGSHGKIMSRFSSISTEAANVSVETSYARLPRWDYIAKLLTESGKFHQLESPSSDHKIKIVRIPKVTIFTIPFSHL